MKRNICMCLLFGLLSGAVLIPAEGKKDDPTSNDGWKMADRMIESIGGREVWAAARSLYVKELAFPASVQGPLTAEFWRDLEKPAYRSVVKGPTLQRETRWTEKGGWVIRDGVKTDLTPEKLQTEISGWRNQPYVMYHKLAAHDPALRPAVGEKNRLEIYDAQDGGLLCWFAVDAFGALLLWGNIYEGEVSEHVYGPLRDLGKVRMPAWGTATTGSWRFEYVEVVPMAESLQVEL